MLKNLRDIGDIVVPISVARRCSKVLHEMRRDQVVEEEYIVVNVRGVSLSLGLAVRAEKVHSCVIPIVV